MIVLLSPAKTLKFTPTDFNVPTSLPVFLDKSTRLVDRMRDLNIEEVAHLMSISNALARLNYERYQLWSLPFTPANATPALWTFMGDVYEGLNAHAFSKAEALLANSTVRIISGLYGVLRPFDLMQPYRLEMGIKLTVDGKQSLYDYWGKTIVEQLLHDLKGEKNPVVINLASQEYYKAVVSIEHSVRVVTPSFYETASGKPKMVGIHAKRARGLMTRYIVKEKIRDVEHLKGFGAEGYSFSEPLSKGDKWAFVR